jgi:hypothetical protein
MALSPRKQVVVVAGDVTFDWNLAYASRPTVEGAGWSAATSTRACCQRGGAALLGDLIKLVAEAIDSGIEVRLNLVQEKEISTSDSRFHRSYAIWRTYEKKWRVKEFLGIDLAALRNRQRADECSAPTVIVLDDANLGFRTAKNQWPLAVTRRANKTWYVLKMSHPVAQGPLWDQLVEKVSDRLIVVIPVNDLRRQQVQISRQISWERTAEDVLTAVSHGGLGRLSQCAHTVISFDTAGAILVSKTSKSPKATLFFDSLRLEGDWIREFEGMMIGYNTTLTAAIVRAVLLNPENPDLDLAIQAGTKASRTLHLEGYGKAHDKLDLQFPHELIVASLADTSKAPLSVAVIPRPAGALKKPHTSATKSKEMLRWTILAQSHPNGFENTAAKIVQQDIDHLLDEVPITRLGKLVLIDRQEIEALRSIRSLIEEYQRRSIQQPLSIAVFGPPGSGKSFYVKQVAGDVLKNKGEPLTFNLSQFDHPEDLLGAFHQVRDEAIRGRLPLVFWDEFDTSLGSNGSKLGWLRYFLAPMQDGTFQQGDITHPIGRCIFVFAGATSERMDELGNKLSKNERSAAKVPDFLSRLKGYLNILGPNPIGNDRKRDPAYLVRRALLLRVMLKQSAPELFQKVNSIETLNIQPGVMNAFLGTISYRHGARSIESIINMSRLKGNTSFELSGLPSQAQLDLHVDGAEFLKRASQK